MLLKSQINPVTSDDPFSCISTINISTDRDAAPEEAEGNLAPGCSSLGLSQGLLFEVTAQVVNFLLCRHRQMRWDNIL